MPRGCGPCNLCCKLLNVPDIGKPALMTCWWTGLHGGCIRHGEKQADPALMACGQFKCLWLASQDREDPGEVWPRHWRPDVSKIVFGPQDRDDPKLMHVHVDPERPTAWREPEIYDFMQRQIAERGLRFQIHLGDRKFMVEAAVG